MTRLHRRNTLQRLLAAALCLLLLAVLLVPASAAEGTISCTYVRITGDGFVADTMNGVESLYNLYGPTLQCVELITRYYQEVYGLEIRCSDGGPTVLNSSDLYFEEDHRSPARRRDVRQRRGPGKGLQPLGPGESQQRQQPDAL